jgi:hypothetical protein
MTKRIGFEALIYEVKTRSLKTGDRSMRITLEVDAPPDELIATLGALQRADQLVGVAIAETETT